MPYSYHFFKEEVKQHILTQLSINPSTRILDVGVGCGTYSDLLQVPMDGVEIYPPYIERFGLLDKYVNLIQDDICNIDFKDKYDYIILGDVLEHITTDKAQDLINRIDECGIKCLVAVPYHYFQGEWEGNVYETHHQPDLSPEVMKSRYPSLRLLYGDNQYGYYINYKTYTAPNLIISAGRRKEYLIKTLMTFAEANPTYKEDFNEVWLLDDRSSSSDRYHMDLMLQKWFPDRSHIVTFNSNRHFGYVDKFNMIKNLMGDSEYVFLLEDDWVSLAPLNLKQHIQYMESNPAISQIMFSQPFDLQWPETQVKSSIDETYWRNPWPHVYKHTRGVVDGFLIWNEVFNQHYGNNPSIFRRRVFEGKNFINDHGWECHFADYYAHDSRLMYMTKQQLFLHIGENSLTAV